MIYMAKVNLEKHIWEGWTVGAIYDKVKPFADNVQNGRDFRHTSFKNRADIADWIKNEYPNFKKGANDVSKLLASDYGLDDKKKEYER